jgi:anti-sigma-K factor RskA
MTSTQSDLDRLAELSIAQALGDLSDEEQREYAELRMRHPDFDDALSERAAAAALSAAVPDGEPIPDSVAATIVDEGERYLAERPRSTANAQAPRASRAAGWGWLAVAASILVVGVGLWLGRGVQAPRSPSEQRAALLASGHALVRSSWSAGGDAMGVGIQGDVVWDPQTQTGFMRFVGLRANAPSREQYQLWIFDAERDERYPVDGGVFDVSSDGEVIVPINARLRVSRATLFAVTVEKPGGVVVSSRERIAALAKIS